MSEIDIILSEVCRTLEEGEISAAVSRYPHGDKRRHTRPVVAVGLKGGSAVTAGFAEYLGEEYDEAADSYSEVYGKRLEMQIGLGIYSPASEEYGAAACLRIFGEAASALTKLPSGIRVKEIICGDTVFDETSGMFLCGAEVKCAAFLRGKKSEGTEFLEFRLKGALVS